nr:phage portal protein, lambda family protein [Salmonella sp. NCTC 7297]
MIELVEAQEGYSILQDSVIAAFTRPLYRRWLAAAVTSGSIRRFAKYVAPSGKWSVPIPFCQLTLQTGALSGYHLFAFRRRELILLFASPVIEL